VRFLLDTHVLFRALQSPERLGQTCRQNIEDTANELNVSSISHLEFGQLVAAGRIQMKGTLDSWLHRGAVAFGLTTLDITPRIALLAYNLPGKFHKDPADRILVATAIHHGLTLATADDRILSYPHVMSTDARH
jgi:PIN domain nuclease of toxin-antitoxin system